MHDLYTLIDPEAIWRELMECREEHEEARSKEGDVGGRREDEGKHEEQQHDIMIYTHVLYEVVASL